MSASECINRIGEIQVRMDSISAKTLASAAANTPAPSPAAATNFADALNAVTPATTTPADPSVAAPAAGSTPAGSTGAATTDLVEAINSLTKAITSGQTSLAGGMSLAPNQQSSLTSLLTGASGSALTQQSELSSLLGVTL